jgi:glycosyltransferase involved in cell wall biosynthesis
MFGAAPFTILPNAIDTAYWEAIRARHQPPGGRIEIVAALRLHPRKRPLLLLDALRTLPQGLDIHLSIAGEGPLRASLEQRIAADGLGARVTLCGQQSRSALADLLARADLFAMPTRHESFGIAGLEARTAGVPVLAMQSAGARDFLTPGLDSLLAADDRAFTAALHRFATDSGLRAQLAQGAAAPLPGYDWADVVARCRRHYAEAIALAR